MKRPLILTSLLILWIVVLLAQIGRPPRGGALHSRAEEAAQDLFKQGCTEVRVVFLPDWQRNLHVHATCTEWQETQHDPQ